MLEIDFPKPDSEGSIIITDSSCGKPTAEDLVNRAIYQDGFSSGWDEGYKTGYMEGRKQGWKDNEFQKYQEGNSQLDNQEILIFNPEEV